MDDFGVFYLLFEIALWGAEDVLEFQFEAFQASEPFLEGLIKSQHIIADPQDNDHSLEKDR